jgi:hypothetical protein
VGWQWCNCGSQFKLALTPALSPRERETIVALLENSFIAVASSAAEKVSLLPALTSAFAGLRRDKPALSPGERETRAALSEDLGIVVAIAAFEIELVSQHKKGAEGVRAF